MTMTEQQQAPEGYEAVLVTCSTEGCAKQGQPVDAYKPSAEVLGDMTWTATCGACGQPIQDVTTA